MRRWIVVFMLLLLPIRGLVGDAMAYSMLPAAVAASTNAAADTPASHSDATNSVAVPAAFHWLSGLFDYQNAPQSMAGMPCHQDVAQAGEPDASVNQCSTCQACHLSAATPVQWQASLPALTTALPLHRPLLWHSAELRPLLKTPVV